MGPKPTCFGGRFPSTRFVLLGGAALGCERSAMSMCEKKKLGERGKGRRDARAIGGQREGSGSSQSPPTSLESGCHWASGAQERFSLVEGGREGGKGFGGMDFFWGEEGRIGCGWVGFFAASQVEREGWKGREAWGQANPDGNAPWA